MDSLPLHLHVLLAPAARARLDQLLHISTAPSAQKETRIREWAAQTLHKELGMAEDVTVDPFAEFRHVPLEGLPHRDRRILELFQEGHSFNHIARVLNEEGIPSKQGKEWRHRSVQLVLERIRKDYPLPGGGANGADH